MSSDTHADTIRERILYGPLERDHVTALAALDALVAELERERARADRAEAALTKARAALANGSHDDLGRMGRAFGILDAALSAGSGGREPTP